LSKAKIQFNENNYLALLYIPDPKTKIDHFSKTSVIEVISQKIPLIKYGDVVELFYNPLEVDFYDEPEEVGLKAR